MQVSRNAVIIGFLLAMLAVTAVLGYVGVARWGEIGEAVERRTRAEAERFLRASRDPIRAAWREAETRALGRARNEADLGQAEVEQAERSRGPRLMDMRADRAFPERGRFALDPRGSLVFPADWPPLWRPYAEIGPRDREGAGRFDEAERLEFQDDDLQGALAIYRTLGTEAYGLTLRNRARIAAGAVACKRKRFEEAETHYRAVLEDPGLEGVDPRTRALAWFRVAVCREAVGDVRVAAETCRDLAEALISKASASNPLAGLGMASRRFYVDGVLEALERLEAGGEAKGDPSLLRERWRSRRREDAVLETVRTRVLPALQRVPCGARRIRIEAELAGKPVLAVVAAMEPGRVGVLLDPGTMKSALPLGRSRPDAPFALRLRMRGESDTGTPALASTRLFPGLDAAVLSVRLRDPGAPGRETARRRATLLALLGLGGVVLVAGAVMVLRRLKKEMDLSRLKSDFFANVSHDLRTPLAIIRSSAETLKLGRVKEEGKKGAYLDAILKEAQRIDALVGNVLEASRVELGRKTYRMERLSPGALASGVEQDRRLYLEEAGFDFDVSIEEGLPDIRGDVESLRLAMYNLLENAVKYSGERKEVVLEVARRDGDVGFRVLDRGRGIAPEDQQRIFERFTRAGSGLGDAGGVGLGLALVLETVKAHGGRIEVEGREGGGAVFELRLPAAPEA